jgi:tetratricopeptide (TPR) repeat protein
VSNGSEASLGERLNRKLHRLFVALILLWVVLAGFRPMMDNVDLGFSVAQGRWMIDHAAFYRQDHFNYPNLGHAVIDEYPLFQVVLHGAWSLGWWGPCVLAAVAYAVLVGALIRAARFFDLGTSSLPPIAIGLMLVYFQVAFPLRPHLVTYLGVTLLGIFLLRHRHETNWTAFWPMALLQIAWTNSHSAFVLGPAMVGIFGAEMTFRRALAERTLPWATIRTWFAAFLVILLACFVNPHGWARFIPPFFQDSLESIRAYVGEMEPLSGGLAMLYGNLTLLAVFVVALAIFFRRGAVSYTFLFFAFFFYLEALTLKKAWPVFGLFLPLLVLSTGAFSSSAALRKPMTWLSVIGHSIISAIFACAVFMEIAPSWPTSIFSMWREYDRGRSELSFEAAAWMKTHQVDGRLFHRCEDGGMLQAQGFDHGETFSDTGFGKYDESFIHEVGLVNERPASIPGFLKAYQPDYVICSTFCYRWPYYLRQNGWQPIFYSPNSSVWALPGTRPDLARVTDSEIETAFDRDIATNGLPVDTRLLGRNLIALNSMGLEDFAFVKLTSLPKDMHRTPWYWEAARFLCVSQPEFSPAHRQALLAEAEQLPANGVTAEFRAYALDANGDTDGALKILESIPPGQLGNYTAELLLKIYLDRHRPEALALAQRTDCWDLRNGHHWQYLAQAEEEAGHADAAARAWKKAVFYCPDDPALLAAASAFAAKYQDDTLAREIEATSHPYGVR